MPEKHEDEKEQIDEARSAARPIDFAFWDVPSIPFKVIYSLPLFHEIDFVVNEGYRKIPHGGIEVGGLLFGAVEKEVVRIEAFRPIYCEHASGPTLTLSERDLTELEQQLAEAATDTELRKLQPVGWFLAHTRGPMELTDAEAKNFDRFFPQPFQVTVLVKPERFQPTRFGFLVRETDGKVPRDATARAIILPLPGRSQKAGQLVPSIPAPTATNAKRAVQRHEEDAAQESVKQQAVSSDLRGTVADEKLSAQFRKPSDAVKSSEPVKPPKTADPAPLSIWRIPPDADITEAETEEPMEDASESSGETRSPAEREARRRLSRDRMRLIEQAFPAPVSDAGTPPIPFGSAPLPSPLVNIPRPVIPSAYDRYSPGTGFKHTRDESALPPSGAEAVLNPRSITALALAALLGCLVGYVAYLQLPAPVIPIDVRPLNQSILVSWPPDETRNAIYAAIRLNDGPPVPLSADEKRAGQVSLTASNDFKVEVMARNWIRDSRGIVQYLHSASENGQEIPPPTSQLP